MPTNLTPLFICLQFNKNFFKNHKKDNFNGKILAQSQQKKYQNKTNTH